MNRNLKIGLILLLIGTGLAVYWDTEPHEFITFDDDVYITANEMVRKGFTWEGFIWAFTSPNKMYWHPVTWLSHMIDSELYGLNAKGHHFNNLLLHITNAVLLFLALYRMSHAAGRSFFVAALFLVHPLGVESVAWISERKNVLAGLFWMLTLLSYIYYTERPALSRYCLILFTFVLGLMTKPILVTMPFLFFLLDYWPLKRMGRADRKNDKLGKFMSAGEGNFSFALVIEKIPLLFLSGASVYWSSLVAQGHGTWVSARLVPFTLRIQNALISYPAYIKKMVWPSELAPFYPYPQQIPLWESFAADLFLVGVTALAVRRMLKNPYFLVGWLWFVGTLLPVLGLVQQGLWPKTADRFVYIPLIGLFVIIAWGLVDLGKTWRAPGLGLVALGGIAVLSLGMVTRHQNAYWRNSITLFEHTLNVTKRNFPAHMNLGIALALAGKAEEAVSEFQRALESGHPRPQDVHYNLGQAYASMEKYADALIHLRTALSLDPEFIDPHISLGTMFLREGQWDQAESEWARVLELDPKNKKALNNMGVVMLHRGKAESAIEWFTAALKVDSDYLMAKKNLEIATARRNLKGKE
jgi:tetratricopeptide (TPR) repeat protein